VSPSEATILVLDLGTQSLRASVLDRAGNLRSRRSVPVTTRRLGEHIEQDAVEWGHILRDLLRQVGAERGLAESICAITACGTLGGAVALDFTGAPIRPALLYTDPRPATLIDTIESTRYFGQLRRQTGWRVFGGDLLPQVLWLAREEPGTYARTNVVLDSTGYLNYLLTGKFSMDAYSLIGCYAAPGSTQLPRELLLELNLSESVFGKPVEVGSVLGLLGLDLARECGILQCPVISIPFDSMTAFLGAGLREAGDALDISGTVTSFGVVHPHGVVDHARRIYSLPLPSSLSWLVRGSTSSSGSALEWARGQFIGGAFDEFDQLALESPPGANGVVFLPYLSGERAPLWTTQARGLFFGLTASTSRGDLARAVYEGICCSLRHIQSVMESNGVAIERVRLGGGLSRNPLLNQIKADITGKTLLPLRDYELTTLGATAIAGQTLGWYADASAASAVLLQTGQAVTPNARNTALYDRHFSLYLRLVEQMLPIFEDIRVPECVPVR
jgi:xylulokinase